MAPPGRLHKPVLVGWSSGGFIVCDYLRAHGQDAIAAVNLVGGAVLLNATFDHIGPGFLEHAPGATAPDLPTSVAAVRRWLRACTARPMSEEVNDDMRIAREEIFGPVLVALPYDDLDEVARRANDNDAA